jgi:phosphatidate phosphatase LPIN
MLDKASLKKLSEQKVMKDFEAVSGFLSTPSDLTLNEEVAPQAVPTPAAEQRPRPLRKFVKTLRLTSDQLVCVFFLHICTRNLLKIFSRKRLTSSPEQM